MAPKHDEIVKSLGDGWSMAWDTNKIDRETHKAMDRVVQENADSLWEIIADAETGFVKIEGKSVTVSSKASDESVG